MGQWVGPGHITKYQINLDLIDIIQLWIFWTFFGIVYLNDPSPLWGYFISCHYQGNNLEMSFGLIH